MYTAFDLEIAKEIEPDLNWADQQPPIACAMAVSENKKAIFQAQPQLSKAEALEMLEWLEEEAKSSILTTWNGCSFDFQVIAQQTGEYARCARLALEHVDLMVIVLAYKGHYLGLDKALRGAGLIGKLHSLTLKDGSEIGGMNGAMAPQLWAAGETDAVLDYLQGDVDGTLALAKKVAQTGRLFWISYQGTPNTIEIARVNGRLPTVAEAFQLPLPNTKWMSAPAGRHNFVAWMPKEVIEPYNMILD